MFELIVHFGSIPFVLLVVATLITIYNRNRPTHVVIFLQYIVVLTLTGLFSWAIIVSDLMRDSGEWILPFVVALVIFLVTLLFWDISRRKDLERQQSITIVSHNLLTPLTRIKYAIGTLLHETSTLPEEKRDMLNELAQHVMEDADRLVHGTTVLLEFSDLADRTDTTTFGNTDVSQVLDELVESFRPSMVAKNLNFKIEKPNGPIPNVSISKFYLKTVLEVILDNAHTYTPIGGAVTLALQIVKKDLVFSVTDTGIGLKPENMKHIFERFYVPTDSAAIKDSGMGLGLSVAKDIITRNRGKMWVTSDGPGKGSTFSFSIKYV